MANTLSIIAIAISLFALYIEFHRDVKLNKINLKSEYFKQLYFKILLEDIPFARNDLYFDADGVLSNYENFVDLFNNLLGNSMYYKYTDSDYYIRLKSAIQELEDYVYTTANCPYLGSLHDGIFNTIDEHVEDVFSILTNKYEKG